MMETGSLWTQPLSQSARSLGPRYLAVYFPAFRVERCGWQAEAMVAMVAEQRQATRLVAMTPAAYAQGLREGMTAVQARSLVSDVILEPLEEEEEAEDQRAMARAFEVLCDRLKLWDEDTLMMEISSTSALYGGEADMLKQVRSLATSLGHICRMGLSDHPRASSALVRWSDDDVCVARGLNAVELAPLPLETLQPTVSLRHALHSLGLRTVGDLARLDLASVGGRFGPEGVALHRVATGGAALPWAAAPACAPLERVELLLDDEVIDVEGLVAWMRRGLEQLCHGLNARDEALSCLDVRLEPSYGSSVLLRLRVGRPTSDPDAIIRLLAPRCAAVELDGPVVRIALYGREVVPARGYQEELLERRESLEPLSELLARLEDVLGEAAVFCADLVEHWKPEESWRGRRVTADIPPVLRVSKIDPVALQEASRWCEARPRPTLIRHPPRPIRVREEDERPVAILEGRGWWRLPRQAGPERLSGAWWRHDGGFDRSYWRVQLSDGVGWIFRERSQWFLQGWF
jgi:protein ImuB